jgi:hypothetical protein
MNTPKSSAVAQVITVEAYQRPNLVVYAILVVFLALVECGIVITGITLVMNEIDVLTTMVVYTGVALLFAIPFIWLLRYYLKELQEYRAIEKGFAGCDKLSINADFNSRTNSGSVFHVSLFTTGTPATKLAQSPAANAPRRRFRTQRIAIDFANGTAGTVSVQRIPQKPTTGLPANTANVYWVITTTKTGIAGTSIVFKYTDTDVTGFVETALQLYTRPVGGGAGDWIPVIGEVLTTANNTITATVNTLGEFTLGDIGDNPLPVELTSFRGVREGNAVRLTWTTASEKNNAGFEVQRRSEKQGASAEWQVLGFVRGAGTTSDAKSYSFVDRTASGKVQYRLKQVDFDGQFEYSPIVEVEAGLPRTFELAQNYPNPFNPTTLISYQLPVASDVSLKVYDVLGREVMTLVNGKQEAGSYNLNFNASNLSSGVYFYRLQAGNFVSTKKMMLVK